MSTRAAVRAGEHRKQVCVLSAALAALAVTTAVWLVIPAVSRQRLMLIHGHDHGGGDSVMGFLNRRKHRDPTPRERLAVCLRTLSSELRAGAAPHDALARAAGRPAIWPRALAAARIGEAVEVGFAADAADNPELSGALRQLAACWHVGVTRGSGLAVSVERLGLSLRAQRELHSTLRNELAAPRATSRMLALLPVLGIAMGYLLGADPVSWFLGSSVGAVVLGIAVILTAAGTVWTQRIVQRIEREMV